jgi:mRNA-degrading endonuclease RelE of RelBE toxin-antitoxin system
MNAIEKFLSRLEKARRDRIAPVISRIEKWDLSGLDVKKLKGFNDAYRVRVGKVRLIFSRNVSSGVTWHSISNRDDTTYNL